MKSLRFIKLSCLVVWALFTAPFVYAQDQIFTDVAVGVQHICGLTDGGEVECFTEFGASRFDAPDDLPLLTDITGGLQHSCGITVDGGAVCWGSPAFGALNVPEIDAPLVSISAGGNHTCAVDEVNRAVCWGLDTNEQTQVPGDGFGESGLGFIKVSASNNTSCGVETDGSISCWSTDPTILDTGSLTGTFVDLEIQSGTACGLTDTGDIQCWSSLFEPPINGPYTDMVVRSSAICGLNESQIPDCTFNPNGNFFNDPSLYETTTQFVSLESRSAFVFQAVLNVCGVTVNSTIECLDVSNLSGLPGGSTNLVNPELEVDLNLTASINGFTFIQVELFWTPLAGGIPVTNVEIFRDGELIDTVNARFSFVDNAFDGLGIDSADYQVRAIDENGNVGEFSNVIIVNRSDRTVSGANTDNLAQLSAPPRIIDNIRAQFVNVNTFLLAWEGPPAGENGLKAYEIRVNNETIALTDTNIYLLENVGRDVCQLISVAAISDDDRILDFRSTLITRFQGSTFECSRG